jgi:DNA-binding NarL/FixJ family response regulator
VSGYSGRSRAAKDWRHVSTTTLLAPAPITGLPAPPRLRLVGRAEAPEAACEIRVLIADGHALVRAAFKMLLETESGISVVAEASTAEEAVDTAAGTRPDVVLIDAALNGCIEATGEIARLAHARVMILTARDSDECVFDALRAGASGFLLRDTEPDELVKAVRVVAHGDALLSPSTTRQLLAEFASLDPPHTNPDGLEELTQREREVMVLAARGFNNSEIGERLVVSPATAKTHVGRAMMKLHARNRAQLVAFAYESGLVQAPTTRPA